jgi:hypothetical protein
MQSVAVSNHHGGGGRWRRVRVVAAAAGLLGGVALAGLVAREGVTSTVAATVRAAGSWASDHAPAGQLAAAPAGRPPPPAVPKGTGWEATWDGLANRYYFYNQNTQETSWDLPEKTPALKEPGIYDRQEAYKKLTWGAQRPQIVAHTQLPDTTLQQTGGSAAPAAASPAASDGGPGSSSVNAVIAYWSQRGAQEMQQAKDAGYTAAVSDSYEDIDLSKGRFIHKTFKGATGGGEGYWPADPPYFPKPGEVDQQGLQAAIDENYDEYDMARGIADHKIFKDGVAGAGSNSGWHAAYHHGLS